VGFVDGVNVVHDIKDAVFLVIATDKAGNFLQIFVTIAHGNSVASGCYHGHIIELIAHGTGLFGFYAQVFV
jgi:pantothenate kinase